MLRPSVDIEIGVQFGLEPAAIGVLVASLLLGTPIIGWLGAIASALTLGSRGGGALPRAQGHHAACGRKKALTARLDCVISRRGRVGAR